MSEGRVEKVAAETAEESFEALIQRYEQNAFALYETLVPGGEGIIDGLSAAFAAALNGFRDRDGRGSFEALLYQEIIQSALGVIQQNEVGIPEESAWQPSVLNSPRMVQQSARRMDSAVHALPIEYRIVFALREVLRASSEMVQEVLHLSDLEVRAYMHRARVMLFESMKVVRVA